MRIRFGGSLFSRVPAVLVVAGVVLLGVGQRVWAQDVPTPPMPSAEAPPSAQAPPGAPSGTQVVQRGSGGAPSYILDDTQQWSVPVLVAQTEGVDLYVQDTSDPQWLARNYRDFIDKHQYVITTVTQYKRPSACRASQVQWGNSDAASINACSLDIAYRIHLLRVDAHLKTISVKMAAMVGHDGQMDPGSVQDQGLERNWTDLPADVQEGLQKTTETVAKQMKVYDARVQSVH
jgi:hypothetical protein